MNMSIKKKQLDEFENISEYLVQGLTVPLSLGAGLGGSSDELKEKIYVKGKK